MMLPNYFIGVFAFFYTATSLLTNVSGMTEGKDNGGKAVLLNEEEDEFQEFTFSGSIEPKIETKPERALEKYQILVYSKTVRMAEGLEWREPVAALTDHKFKIKLRFHKKDLLNKIDGGWKKAAKRFLLEKWLFPTDEQHHSPTGIEQIRVEVRAQFDKDKEKSVFHVKGYCRSNVKRTWVFVDPNFSLHYQLNVGVLEGNEYWLKVKIALSPGIQMQPKDKIVLEYVNRKRVFPMNMYDQVRYIKNFTYGKLIGKNEGEADGLKADSMITHFVNGNILNIAIKLGAVRNYLFNASDRTPIIYLLFEHDTFGDENCRKSSVIRHHFHYMGRPYVVKNFCMLCETFTPLVRFHTSGSMADQCRKCFRPYGICIRTIPDENRARTSSSGAFCTICLSEIEENQLKWRSKCCRNYFHMDCIQECRIKHKSICPICRADIKDTEEKYFKFLFEDPVLSDEHYSFEYKYSMTNGDVYEEMGANNVNAPQQFWEEERDTEEQMEFLKIQHKWSPAKRELPNFLKRSGSRKAIPFWVQCAIPLAESRLKTVKVARLATTNEDGKGKGKKVEMNEAD